MLYFVLTKSKGNHEFYTVNTTSLELENILQVDANIPHLEPGSLFVDDEYLCLLSSSKDVSISLDF